MVAVRMLCSGLGSLALTLGLFGGASLAAAAPDLQGRAFTSPDGLVFVGSDGLGHRLELTAATPDQLADVPLVTSPPVVRLDRDPRVTGQSMWWTAGDAPHADPTLQGRVVRMNGVLGVYRDRVLYQVELADVSAEQAAGLPLAADPVDHFE